MDEYEEVHDIIIRMAGAKMGLNKHKGRIEDAEPDKLFSALQSEMIELGEAMAEADIMHVIEEAGDVFNFLVGVVHQQITLYRMRK